jgi:cytochrome c-type biogenesis protein CcmH/NrfG
MPNQKPSKGYIKTENLILAIFISLAVGFVGGVVFGVYRTTAKAPLPASPGGQSQPPEMSAAIQTEIDQLIKQTGQNPDDVSAWRQLGDLYFDTGEVKNAIQAYQRSLAIDPQNADVWTDLGVMLHRNDQPQKAVEAFDKAIAIDSRHEISRFNKGIVLLHDLKKQREALEAWEELLKINPNAKAPGGQTVKALVAQIRKQLK